MEIRPTSLFMVIMTIIVNTSKQYRDNNTVFWFKGWKEIYKIDNERKMAYKQANESKFKDGCKSVPDLYQIQIDDHPSKEP